MTHEDEEAWAAELAYMLAASMRILRWVFAAVAVYVAWGIWSAWGL